MVDPMPRHPEASRPASAARFCILVLNAGSSSVKFALFSTDQRPLRHLSGAVDGIGHDQGRFHAKDETGGVWVDEKQRVSNQEEAIELVLSSVEQRGAGWTIIAVGHRIVHGGPDCDCPKLVAPELEARLQKLIPLAPLHMPHNLAGIASVRTRRPHLPQVACFDTAFHETLPKLSRMTGLPRDIASRDIRRYGFHGLSYEFIVDELRRTHGAAVDDERVIVAHLGNGASMAAIRRGRSVETTMGFSTLAGLPMGTRSGSLDPGIVLYLILEEGLSAEAVQRMLYERSGLLGISGASSDMQELLSQADHPHVAEAIDYFCARARAYIGSLATSLRGLDRLVFTGGIGANAPEIRARICKGLEFLGIDLDTARNRTGQGTISRDGTPVTVEAIPTDEELMIAQHTLALIPLSAAAGRA
jgi:acetate kinase